MPGAEASLLAPRGLAAPSEVQAHPALSQVSDGSPLAAVATISRAQAPEAVASAPAPSTPLAPPTPPMAQVETGLRWMLKGGSQEAQLQLHPDSLGQVTIHLKVEGGEVHARLWITEPASVQVVREGRPHLEQALRDQGLQLGSFDLQQGHRPFQEAPSAPTLREPVVPGPVFATARITRAPGALHPEPAPRRALRLIGTLPVLHCPWRSPCKPA